MVKYAEVMDIIIVMLTVYFGICALHYSNNTDCFVLLGSPHSPSCSSRINEALTWIQDQASHFAGSGSTWTSTTKQHNELTCCAATLPSAVATCCAACYLSGLNTTALTFFIKINGLTNSSVPSRIFWCKHLTAAMWVLLEPLASRSDLSSAITGAADTGCQRPEQNWSIVIVPRVKLMTF